MLKDNVTVSKYLDLLNSKLKIEKAKIIGEIFGIQEYPGRSYLYFSLKDKEDNSTIKCFMWKRDFSLAGVKLEEGLEIIVSAYPNIYKPNGGLTLQVEMVELLGEGALKKAYDELKNKLDKEGLFSNDRKRIIPLYPKRIGVITSKSGAVINDFLTNIGKYGFEILFVDSKVEGADSINDLLNSIKTLKDKNIDVLVLMRGGGSLESFQSFNNEKLVREIANFPVPVITGIGHDKDIPLVSFVSDLNVSTPTAVAHYLNKSWDEILSYINISEEKIFSSFSSFIQDSKFKIEHTQIIMEQKFSKLFDFFSKIESFIQISINKTEGSIKSIYENLNNASSRLERGMEVLISSSKLEIKKSEDLINISNPERQLKKGYSIVKFGGKVIKKQSDVKKDEDLDIIVSDGIIRSKVL